MNVPDPGVADGVVAALYVVLLLLPGGLIGLVARLRGWTLVAAAPLFGYAVTGIAGPLWTAVGLGWSPASWALGVAVVLAAAVGLRVVTRRREPPGPAPLPRWSPAAQAGVALCTVLAVAVGIVVVMGGIRTLSAVPQDWDAVFHANGIRYIAETGDGSLSGMGRTNWYEPGAPAVFYPNSYHLLAAVMLDLTGSTVPTVLNAHTIVVPGLLAVSLVAMVRRFGGRPVLAGASALTAVAVTSLYDSLWRGPLLPFATGVALSPVLVVLALDTLDQPTLRRSLRRLALFALGMAGLLCLHPSVLVGAVLFTVPAIVHRWLRRPRAVPREAGTLLLGGVLAAAGCAAQLAGSISSAANLAVVTWPAELTVWGAVGDVVTFAHGMQHGQLGLTAFLVVGLLAYPRLGALRWVGVPALLFGALFVVAAASDEPWAKTVTSLWWNDRWRLIALTAVPLCVLVGHGVATAQRVLADALTNTAGPRVVAAGSTLVTLIVFVAATSGLYIARDQARMENNSGQGPAVSPLEIAGMHAVAAIVPPGQRVLNDRGDGSAWLYALTGVPPVAGHYDEMHTGADATLLAERFNQYPTDPAVRAAAARLGVEYVQLDAGFLRTNASRSPGLTGLAEADWLTVVYRNPDLVLFRINGADPAAGPRAAEPGPAAASGPLLSDGSG